ncbi:FHIPEP family type III secretion protein, partial [Escherichia coli]|nr:FHIPEP family type III secretion protein [Escherichia coli]
FIVVTKGAERISEVSARFTLDAMPGKQMAIDADLNAGMMIQAINLIGGVCIGIFKYNLSADAAFQQYVLMTIGDGLVA